MKRGKIAMVFSLLITAAVMAAAGSGALDVFSASRNSSMKIVNDASAYLSVQGDGMYAYEQDGQLATNGLPLSGIFKIDFSSTNSKVGGKGFNPQAFSKFDKVFTVTNNSAKTLNVWLEAGNDYPWTTANGSSLSYEVNETTGKIMKGQYDLKKLIWTKSSNFKNVNGISKGSLSYVVLAPGQNFSVDIIVDARGYYGVKGTDWSHMITIKADSTISPTQVNE